MRRIWWSWDIRMRWAYGFSRWKESFIQNYKRAIDAASRYGVEGIVIWGFLRDAHGGIDAAREVCEYADNKNIRIFPGVGIDDYGGVYYQGDSEYSLDTYIKSHKGSQAVNADGTPATHRWPPTDTQERLKGCPSDENLIKFYQESLLWLVDTFKLKGFQIEQGDSGVCCCERCRSRNRVTEREGKTSISDAATRIPLVIQPLLARKEKFTIISELYSCFTRTELEKVMPFLPGYPDDVILSWVVYDAPGKFKIEENISCPRKHGNAAIRTNNDFRSGELDDRENIRKCLGLAQKAGLDMTYIYGEYPDDWPLTRENYKTWSSCAGD